MTEYLQKLGLLNKYIDMNQFTKPLCEYL